MKQIKKDKLCYYCMGCVREETETFEGARNCKEFMPVVENWQKLILEEMKGK